MIPSKFLERSLLFQQSLGRAAQPVCDERIPRDELIRRQGYDPYNRLDPRNHINKKRDSSENLSYHQPVKNVELHRPQSPGYNF